jgi:hypothetical protein
MSKKWIVHGTEYMERQVEVQVNAPTEELAIIAADNITLARARRSKNTIGSFSVDWAECIGEEKSRFEGITSPS